MPRLRRVLWRFLLLLPLGGCVAGPAGPMRRAAFNPKEYARYARPGTASLEGRAAYHERAGEVRVAAGQPVFANPVTSYSTEWWERVVRQNQVLWAADNRALAYHWETVADSLGRFQLRDLPSGDYYVASRITWTAGGQQRAAWVGQRVHADEGAVITLDLPSVR